MFCEPSAGSVDVLLDACDVVGKGGLVGMKERGEVDSDMLVGKNKIDVQCATGEANQTFSIGSLYDVSDELNVILRLLHVRSIVQ